MCRPPHDRGYSKFVINPDTVRFCASETARFREEGVSYQLLPPPRAPSPVLTTMKPVFSSPVWKHGAYSPGQESGYVTDLELSHKAGFPSHLSPKSQYSSRGFTSVSGAGSPVFSSTFSSPIVQHSVPPLLPPTPSPEESYSESSRTKRTHSKVTYAEGVNNPREELKDLMQEPGGAATHSPRTLEMAEILMSMGAVVRNTAALPETKRARRDSRC